MGLQCIIVFLPCAGIIHVQSMHVYHLILVTFIIMWERVNILTPYSFKYITVRQSCMLNFQSFELEFGFQTFVAVLNSSAFCSL